jgi:hypothetical protein
VRFAAVTAPSPLQITTSHGSVDVRLPSDAPPYAVATDARSDRVDVGVATDPAADHTMDIQAGHGSIEVRNSP